MKGGYWINYRTGKDFEIDEHETWLRRKGNAKKLGLPKKVVTAIKEFKPVKDREKFLTFVMQHAAVMRVRGHGNYVTFEYSSRSRRDPMDSIWLWGLQNAGPYTGMYIVNFATGEKTSIYWREFKEAMDSGGAEAVMRVASTEEFIWKEKIAEELLDLSKRLIGEKEAPAWTIH
jgi:hypothetical protein